MKRWTMKRIVGLVLAACICCAMLGSHRVIRTEAATKTMTRLEFTKKLIQKLELSKKPSDYDRVLGDLYKQLTGMKKLSSVYTYMNCGLTKEELDYASRKYKLAPDKAVYPAAAIKIGLLGKNTFKSKSLGQAISNYYAARMLVKADHYLYGASNEIFETYTSDEVDYYVLYGADKQLLEIVQDPTFTWYETSDRRDWVLEDGVAVAHAKYGRAEGWAGELKFYLIETVYKEVTVSYLEPKISDEDKDFVIAKRISDIGKLKGQTQQRLFAEAYMLGYIKGKSMGDYTDSRKCNPTSKPSAKEAQKMIDMVTDQSLRYPMTQDWKMCRLDQKTLPVTACFYDYILDSYPNSYYETGFEAANAVNLYRVYKDLKPYSERKLANAHSNSWSKYEHFIFPAELPDYLADTSGDTLDIRFKNVNYKFAEETEEYYRHVLNVDYRTIEADKEWYSYMLRFQPAETIDQYISDCLKNHTIIKCDKVAADYSSVYYCNGMFMCKAYVHMKIVSDDAAKSNDDEEVMRRLFCSSIAKSNLPYSVGSKGNFLENAYYTRFALDNNIYTNPGPGKWLDRVVVATGVPFEEFGEVRLTGGAVCSAMRTSMENLIKYDTIKQYEDDKSH